MRTAFVRDVHVPVSNADRAEECQGVLETVPQALLGEGAVRAATDVEPVA